jgi:hypothetical protein
MAEKKYGVFRHSAGNIASFSQQYDDTPGSGFSAPDHIPDSADTLPPPDRYMRNIASAVFYAGNSVERQKVWQ